jgi:drug/metabolite transporter (DMT)-like permease
MIPRINSAIALLLVVLVLRDGGLASLVIALSFPFQTHPRSSSTTRRHRFRATDRNDNCYFMSISIPRSNKQQQLRLRATPFLPDDDLEDRTAEAYKSKFRNETDVFSTDKKKMTTALMSMSSATTTPTTALGQAPPFSIFLLNLVAVILGSQHAVIKLIVDDGAAGPFTLLRFGLAALIASPYTPSLPSLFFGTAQEPERLASSAASDNVGDSSDVESETRNLNDTAESVSSSNKTNSDLQKAWRWGAEMGMWMFLGFSFQAIGLGTTTAQRSGFLLYLNVKFVPFFARIFLGRNISIPTWVSALAAFCGTALLALDGDSIGFNVGDVWSIAAAMTSAMFILRLETASQEVPNAAALNAACLWVVFLLAAIWCLVIAATTTTGGASLPEAISTIWSQVVEIGSSHPWEIIYLSAVTTALANYIQTLAQKDVTAERASIIYSLDPVYGAIFSWFLLGETLGGPQAFVGAGLITVAAATNAFLDFTTTKADKTQTSPSRDQ